MKEGRVGAGREKTFKENVKSKGTLLASVLTQIPVHLIVI